MAIEIGGRKITSSRSALPNSTAKVLSTLLLSGFICLPAFAQEPVFEPFVELVATYTDNLFLAPEGQEMDDYVGQINPGLRLIKNDGRYTSNIYYRAQSVFFASDSDLNTVYNQLAAEASLEMLPDLFFIDLDASIDQSVIDPRLAIPASNVVATQNLGDVSLANVNPYLIHRLGSSRTYARLDYTWGIGKYDDFGDQTFSRVDDFTQQLVGFYLGTDSGDSRFEWSVTYNSQFVDYETISDFKYERAGVGVGLPVSRSFRLVGFAGGETDVVAGRAIGGLDSEYWEAGFRVNAGPDSVLELRTGERFFGTTYFGNLQYSGRVLSASIVYSESPATSALSDPVSIPGTFGVTESVPMFEDPLPGTAPSFQPVRAEVYISRMTTGRVELAGSRSRVYAIFTDEDREFIDSDEGLDGISDGQTEITFGFDYELGPRTNLEIAASWIRYDFPVSIGQTDGSRLDLALVRQLGQKTDFRITIRYAEQESEADADFENYVEHAVDIGFVRRF
jgi:uncharacterized protein (PEP-CTERM system associated)